MEDFENLFLIFLRQSGDEEQKNIHKSGDLVSMNFLSQAGEPKEERGSIDIRTMCSNFHLPFN